jgi:N-acylneuraminate cytidylyltransferase
VILSTDDEVIRRAGVEAGAEAPFLRPAELAGSDVSDLPVFLHALDWLRDTEGYVPDLVVQLRATSPLRPTGLVDAAIEALTKDAEASAARTVTPAATTPFKMWRNDGGRLLPLLAPPAGLAEPFNAPRQVLPPVFWQTGQVDVARVSTLRAGSMTGDRIAGVEVNPHWAVDIDTPADLERAARLLDSGLEVVRPRGSGLLSALAGLELVVFDFDGVMTNNHVWVDSAGIESVVCSREDGHGIDLLQRAGVAMHVLSTEVNEVVAARCRKLNLPCRFGLGAEKGQALRSLVAERGIALDRVAFVGNDENDVECLRMIGLPVVPADAHPSARAVARLVLSRRGGEGAVREFADLLLSARDRPRR